VKELSPKSTVVAAPSIHRVANDRELAVREVNADLMSAPSDRPDMQEGQALGVPGPRPAWGASPCGDAGEARDRVAAARADHHPPAIFGVALERRFDHHVGVARVAPHQREVLLREALGLQLPAERELCHVVLGDDHHAAGVLIEAMHDARPAGLTTRA